MRRMLVDRALFGAWVSLALLLTGCSKPEASTGSAGATASAAAVAIGNLAPAVTLTLHDGKKVRLRDKKGRQVLLYFYPKDGTSG